MVQKNNLKIETGVILDPLGQELFKYPKKIQRFRNRSQEKLVDESLIIKIFFFIGIILYLKELVEKNWDKIVND